MKTTTTIAVTILLVSLFAMQAIAGTSADTLTAETDSPTLQEPMTKSVRVAASDIEEMHARGLQWEPSSGKWVSEMRVPGTAAILVGLGGVAAVFAAEGIDDTTSKDVIGPIAVAVTGYVFLALSEFLSETPND